MQIAAETTTYQSLPSAMLSQFSVTVRRSRFSQHRVIRCNGAVVSFESSEIPVALTRVCLAAGGMQGVATAELQLQVINNGVRRPIDLGRQSGRAASLDQLIGPII